MALSKILPASQEQYAGARNLIINGAMQVAQRGTSTSVTTSNVYTLDRWQAVCGSSFNFDTTITQSTTAPSGFANSLKIEADSVQTPTGGENGAIWTILEGQNLQHLGFGSSDAKSITLSFWVRSNKTGTYSCFIKNNDALYYQVKEYSISSSNTWEHKTITIEPDTANSIDNDNGAGMQIAFNLATGADDKVSPTTSWVSGNPLVGSTNQVNFMDSASNEWYITGVQLEVGEATPFEHRSYGDELARCQRYYYKSGIVESGQSGSGAGSGYSTYFAQGWALPTTMRATPTVLQNITVYTNSTGNQMAFVSPDSYNFRHGGMTGNYSYFGGNFILEAEL